MPEYITPSGKQFTVEGVKSSECPVSVITRESRSAIEQWQTASRMKEIAGASAFGPNLAEWPALTVDAFELLASEQARFEQARQEAESNNH